MLGCQKYKLDRPPTQALAELPHEWGFLTDAFVNDDPFDAVHERTRQSLRRRNVAQSIEAGVITYRSPYVVSTFWDSRSPRRQYFCIARIVRGWPAAA